MLFDTDMKNYWLASLKMACVPCFGFYLLGSVKQIAIANSFVSVSSMIIFGAGIYEFIPRWNSIQVSDDEFQRTLQRDVRPVFWTFYYMYWILEIYLSIYIYMAAHHRDHKKCRRWLKVQIACYVIFLIFFGAHCFWLSGFNVILEACFGVICAYKLYTFWVASCFIRETIAINDKYKFIRDLPDEDVDAFLKGYPVGKHESASINGSHAVQERPYDNNYEISPSMIEKINEIGSGEFGTVFKAIYRIPADGFKTLDTFSLSQGSFAYSRRNSGDSVIVAVKCVKTTADLYYFKALLAELKIMMYIGQHPNIVNLIGACTSHIKERKLDLVVEYCPYKSLDLHLQSRKGLFVNQLDAMGNPTKSALQHRTQEFTHPLNSIMESVSTEDLVRWSIDTARGMEYLYAKNVIHGDLAARNVLLGQDKRAKISDFGLSRRLYSYKKRYVTSTTKHLPWRWMAPESLNPNLNFYLESDIWSLGVTMWEFFSLGDMPYSHLGLTHDFVNQLENGTMKLGMPLYAPSQIYAIMLSCWKVDRRDRINYGELISSLEAILQEFQPCSQALHQQNMAQRSKSTSITESTAKFVQPNQSTPLRGSYSDSTIQDRGSTSGIETYLEVESCFDKTEVERKISGNSCIISENYVLSEVAFSDDYV